MEKVYVIHISVDGLTPHIIRELGEQKLPGFYKIRKNGVFTDHARTDFHFTKTLPNHTAMFTSIPMIDLVSFNEDNGKKIHDLQNRYIYSLYDILKDSGLDANMYVGKNKFKFIKNSYPECRMGLYTNADFKTLSDRGCIYYKNGIPINSKNNIQTLPIIDRLLTDNKDNKLARYNFVHFRGTDSMGHMYGWDSKEYKHAVRAVDHDLMKLLNMIDNDNKNIKLLLTSDHGGGVGKDGAITDHSDANHYINFTIPFYAYQKGRQSYDGARDLYKINPSRQRPFVYYNPDYSEIAQPIRNGDIGNLVLSLLKLPCIKDSVINKNQDLKIE